MRRWPLIAGGSLLAGCLGALSGFCAEPASRPAGPAAAAGPRITMLWSPASLPGQKVTRLENIARHDVVVMGVDDAGFEWAPNRFPAMAESLVPDTVPAGRKNLDRLGRLNPAITVLLEVYFFEEDRNGYPADHAWWLRDKQGRKKTFWPGTWQMDLGNAGYVAHIVRRIAAVHQAAGARAGIFLDNLRFGPGDKAAWTSLLRQVRAACGPDMPVLVNAGWDSTDLDWVAPFVNGVMYEDSVHHARDKDSEAFYARVAALDAKLLRPTISVVEVFGKRANVESMRRELIRTLACTNAAFLYADSTHGHKHLWYEEWDIPLGRPVDLPATPRKGALARRRFEGGEVLWLPASAGEGVTVELAGPMRLAVAAGDAGAAAAPTTAPGSRRRVRLSPGCGVIVVAAK